MPRFLVFLASAVLAGALAGPASAAWTGVTDFAPANPLNKPVGPPSIAVAPDGTAFAAFQHFDGANLRAAVAMRQPGGGFGAVRDLSPAGKDGFDPVVAVDRQGNATLAWLQGPELTIQARFRPAGGDWTEPTTLSPPTVVRSPAIATGDNGAAVVAWGRRVHDQVERVEAATRAAGDVIFGAPAFASPDAGTGLCQAPRVAMDAAGDVAVLWTRRTTTAGDFHVESAVKAAAAAAFQPFELRSSLAGDSLCNTSIQMTPGGRVTAIWDHREGAAPTYVAFADRSAPFATGTWTTPFTKLSNLAVVSSEPTLALDDAGNAGATWLAGGQIVSAFRGGAAFSSPKPLSGATTLKGEALAASPNGDMMAAYVGDSNGNDAIFSARRRLGTEFGDVLPVAVTPPGGAAATLDSPRIALDDEGNAFAVWQRTVGGVSTAQVSGFDPVPPALTTVSVPASGFSGAPVSMAAAASDRMSAPGLRFDFGDGSSAAGGAVEHIYGQPGDYTVTVTATDAAGNAASVTRPVHVGQGPIIGGNGPAGASRVLAAASASWDRLRNGRTKMKTLVVNELAGPEVVKLACKGKGCRHGANRTVRKHGRTVSFTKQVKGMTLRPKASLTITVTRPGFVARVISYTMVKKRDPKKTTRCLKPGAKRPSSC